MTSRPRTVVAFLLVLVLPSLVASSQEDERVRVELAPGTGSKTFEARIEGYQSLDYIVPAEASQQLTVGFRSANMGAYIDIYPPGSDAPMHEGSKRGNRFEGVLPQTGDYRVHVFLMDNAAHRDEIAEFTIDLSLGGSNPDYADGLSGGPDFWKVVGLAAGDELIVRVAPSTSQDAAGRVSNESVLRNLGCRMESGARWCRVQTTDDADEKLTGWVEGRHLAEAAPPTTGSTAAGGRTILTSDDPNAPELYVRGSGEIEVNFKSGCGALYTPDGTRITAGASCSAEELRQAEEAVEAHRRR